MIRFSVHLFANGGHLAEKFDSLEEAALWLLAWNRENPTEADQDGFYVVCKPYWDNGLEDA